MLDTETLFLVDDDQAQILEGNGTGEQRVGTNDQVHSSRGQAFLDLFRFLGRREARERADGDGESRVTFRESFGMLLDEKRRWNQDGDLFAVLNCFKGRTDCDLGFSIAHVAREKAVHRHGLFHVGFHFVDSDELVGCFHVGEGIFQLALPRGVRTESVPLCCLTHRVEANEFLRDFFDGFASFCFGFLPVSAAHLGQCGLIGTRVLRDLIQAVGWNEKSITGLATL